MMTASPGCAIAAVALNSLSLATKKMLPVVLPRTSVQSRGSSDVPLARVVVVVDVVVLEARVDVVVLVARVVVVVVVARLVVVVRVVVVVLARVVVVVGRVVVVVDALDVVVVGALLVVDVLRVVVVTAGAAFTVMITRGGSTTVFPCESVA